MNRLMINQIKFALKPTGQRNIVTSGTGMQAGWGGRRSADDSD